MNKYKHKKTGVIIEKFGEHHYISNDINGFSLHKALVENSSDWEEIEELIHPIGTKFRTHIGGTIYTLERFKNEEVIISDPYSEVTGYPIKLINEFFTDGTWIMVDENNDYEILSFTDMQNTIYYKNKINDSYQSSEYRIRLSEHYAKSNLSINSIKRLSDGEVFTLGDKLNEYDCVITEFQITTDGTLKIISDSKSGANKYIFDDVVWSLENAEKAKILLTTEDGVDIHHGDDLFYLKKLNNLEYSFGKFNWGCNILPTIDNDNYIWFSNTYTRKKHHNLLRKQDFEPKYTKIHMIDFAKYSKSYASPRRVNDAFIKWKKNNKS